MPAATVIEFQQNLCIYFRCRCADDKPFVPIYLVSKEKAESLGLNFTPMEVSLKDTVESLKEKNFLSV